MKSGDMTVAQESKGGEKQTVSEAEIQLWVDEKWYIPIDKKGRCVGPCAEGALGFIVQLKCLDNPEHVLALKMPRLMGETYRENAYINDLMEKELKAVYDINLGYGQPEGLITSGYFGRGGPLKGMINTRNGTVDARAINDSIIMICFEKGKNPRFCAVKADDDKVVYFPESIEDCPVVSIEQLRIVEKEAQREDLSWVTPVFVETIDEGSNETTKKLRIFNNGYALEKSPTGKTWYTCVPSVAYSWAPGTLQESISLGKRKKWRVSDHFVLMHRLASGLNILHSQNMLHGDIRPANVACQRDPGDPKNYSLADYGSFHESGPQAAEKHPQGGTVLGPVIGTERSSAFYSPERRMGLERESADTAAIISPPGSTTLLLVLGWRSTLIDPATSKVRDGIIEEAKAELKKTDEQITDSLTEGDRIQIRDYIFEVIRSRELADKQLLLCKKTPSWKVFQGRIVVKNDEVFPRSHWFPIPRTIELRQWSAATDLYGLGALFLYSVFCSGKKAAKQDSGQIEEDFRVMLGYLESPPYFNSIWKDLEPLRSAMETVLMKGVKLSPKEFANQPYINFDGEEEALVDAGEQGVPSSTMANRKVKTLQNKTVEVVQRMTRTVPGIRRLVDEFHSQLGPFILFIHFVLSCLHRQSHFNEKMLDAKIIARSKEQVFCKDRRVPTEENGAAANALRRLENILKMLDDPKLFALTAAGDLGDFDPRPDPTIREELRLLYEELENFRKQNKVLTDKFLLRSVLKVSRKSRKKFDELDVRASKILAQTESMSNRNPVPDAKKNGKSSRKQAIRPN